MTETSTTYKTRELLGATTVLSYPEGSSVFPESTEQLAVMNPVTKRIVVLARNTTTDAMNIVRKSPELTHPPTGGVIVAPYLYVLSDWTTSTPGRITKFISNYFETSLATVDDRDAGGVITACTATGHEAIIHGRTRGSALVARDPDTLAVLATVLLPSQPTFILPGEDSQSYYVFCKKHRAVERVRWNKTTGRFTLDTPFLVPFAAEALDVATDGGRLILIAPEHIVVYDIETEATVLNHHDINAGFSSVASALDGTTNAVEDGVNDPDYVAALWNARFNPGKSRQERDYYIGAELFAKLGVATGTKQAPTDPLTSDIKQVAVRRLGERWVVIDGIRGEMVLSGTLVFWYRSWAGNAKPKAVAYDEPDAIAGAAVSRDQAANIRMTWTGTASWVRDFDDPNLRRYAWFDGSTWVDFGSPKVFYLPESFTIGMWVKPDSFEDQTMTLLTQQLSGEVLADPAIFAIRNGATESYIHLNGDEVQVASIDDGEWHHVAAVYDAGSGTWTAYLDGVGTSGGAVAGWTPAGLYAGSPVRIGAGLDDSDRYFGLLGDVRVYRRAMPASFLEDLFDRGPTGLGGSSGGGGTVTDGLLLESGDFMLLEDNDFILLE